MVSVAEQFSNLRDTLGSILGIFAILRWMRTLFAKLTGRPPPADATSLTPSAFAKFQGLPSTLPNGSPVPPRPSKKPFVVFILAAFGLPYLMGKMIRALAKSQEEQAQRAGQNLLLGPDGRPLPPDQQPQLDPSQLDFCRLKFDFSPETSGQPPNPGVDVEVKKGDVVAVLTRTDPVGNASEWWRCRTRDGKIGYLPSPYLDIIKRASKQLMQESTEDSRAQTITSQASDELRSKGRIPKIAGKMGDISAESFQKSQFYS
jgi:peroxin-13